jgi:hypothetical protein
MNFDKTDLIDGTLIIQNIDNSIVCIPEENCTEEEQALFDEFRAEYPNGKPIIPIEPQEPIPTDIEILQQQLKNQQDIISSLGDNLSQFIDYIVTNITTLP